MIIVITPEECIPDEIYHINEMFQEGLDMLHVRKPLMNSPEMEAFLNKIDKAFLSQVVLHSHFELASKYGISRVHIREADRQNKKYPESFPDYLRSTSVHDIETFNVLDDHWEYAFLSPFYPSISKKGYGNRAAIREKSRQRNNPDVKLIALGGINETNCNELLTENINGIALLGAVWQDRRPVEVFRKCRNIMATQN
ncbi:thiamine phosphate synthase [Chryseobacterium populi]|uniref:Thiamine monophosphate synthase n=1 Tax=Chryseobacterium populi TaxID=1144316 RepID=J3CGW6_9FLAO|nr:thiamine phosphate synthase [Chryseobacterium populi]EJL71146.1 thiamine monophosphate synthase [Chryseobacterium populi]